MGAYSSFLCGLIVEAPLCDPELICTGAFNRYRIETVLNLVLLICFICEVDTCFAAKCY